MDILIVEDEADIAELIRLYLSQEGFRCHICRDGNTALDRFRAIQPDLIILDLMIPGLDGLEVCARVRQQNEINDPYIMMLTARGEEMDRIIGLSTGADDYMVKPFSPRELVARVRAVLRRSLRGGQQPTAAYQTAHFTVDIDQRMASQRVVKSASSSGGLDVRESAQDDTERQSAQSQPEVTQMPLELTPLEFDLLATFMSYPGRVWNRSQLIEKLWGEDFFGDERVVDTHVARLRKKIEPDPSAPTYVKTVVGVGYRFEDG
ncbi:winged helix-turn-helix domain-containing protein [cf. Phormidesmis sp. LEGE 11477]|uniref:winged helix-turn-helix domain-containing protein n=1 Tax=cf. Phormidesmis sp. LEGE 11477 TaxID=1828680 RepID=UPI001882E0EF|nr:response regulator transcription factor [cf. Phormidesmis sp. LEGE 11477]MBE9060719.1 response regulator transcription factor [cf. Phormidesmis sp. LEGE 11477]